MVLFHLFVLVLLYKLQNTEAGVTIRLNSNDIPIETLQQTVDVHPFEPNSIHKDLYVEENVKNWKLHGIELSRISNNNHDTSHSSENDNDYNDEYEHLSPCLSEVISESNSGNSGAKTFDFIREEFVKLKDVRSEEISDEIAMRIGSPQSLLSYFVGGKKLIKSVLNEGIRETNAVLEGFHELTDGIERILSKY